MKPDYKNWMPKGMVMSFFIAAIISLVLFIILGVSPIIQADEIRKVVGIVFGILTILFLVASVWMLLMYRAFSYNGNRKMSKQIIEGIAEYVVIPEG